MSNIPVYSKALLDDIFKCGLCGQPLLMRGCSNQDCDNYGLKRTKEWLEKIDSHKERA